jgi:hypothetical protein
VLLAAAACGSEAAATVGGEGPVAPAPPACLDAVAPDEGAEGSDPPNTSRYATSVAVRVRRSTLEPGRELVPEVSLDIPRFVGAYGPEGGSAPTLRDYVDLGTLGASALVSMRVFATQGLRLRLLRRTEAGLVPVARFEAGAPGGVGADAVFPEAREDGWATLSVAIPIDQVALAPAKADRGVNAFAVVVDAASPAACDVTVAVRSLSIRIAAQAPVVLVHGVNDYSEQAWGEAAALLRRSGFLPDLDVDFSGLADKPNPDGKPGFNGSVVDDVVRIEERLRRLDRDYGTRDVHLVAHSKGGIDLVNFLATRYPALKSTGALRVLSLQTLATPHAGSVNADIVAPLRAWATAQGYTSTTDLALWGLALSADTDASVIDTVARLGLQAAVVGNSGPIEPALSDLRTTSEAVRVDQTWEGDPSIAFATYAWDADFERSRWYDELGQLASPPEPGDLFAKYSTDCRGIPASSSRWSRYCIDADEADLFFDSSPTCTSLDLCGAPAWRVMAHGARATVVSEKQTIGSRSTIRVEPYGPGQWIGNDLAVSVASAAHPKAQRNFVLAGPAPRSVPGLRRRTADGRVEAFTAQCARTGGNHLAILRQGKSDLVSCTAADVMTWIAEHAKVPDLR